LNFLYASSNESREVSLIPGIKKHPLPIGNFQTFKGLNINKVQNYIQRLLSCVKIVL